MPLVNSSRDALPSSVSMDSAMPSSPSKFELFLTISSSLEAPFAVFILIFTLRSMVSETSGSASLHAVAIEIVSSAGGADSDVSDSGLLQLVRVIATKTNAAAAL